MVQLLTLLALNTGRVVSAAPMAEQIWPDDPPDKPGNAHKLLSAAVEAVRDPPGPSTTSSSLSNTQT